MLKRIAVVLWWIAAGILAVAAYATYDHYQKMNRCVKTYAEENNREKLRDVEKSNTPNKTLSEQFLIDAGQEQVQLNLTNQRTDLDMEISMCNSEKYGPEPWVLGLIFAIPFLVISYILGGSFLRPPKIK